jgi:hypothetical protein
MRRILRPAGVCSGLRKLHNEELHNLYSSPNIIKMIKPKIMKLTGHVAYMVRRGMLTGFSGKARRKT